VYPKPLGLFSNPVAFENLILSSIISPSKPSLGDETLYALVVPSLSALERSLPHSLSIIFRCRCAFQSVQTIMPDQVLERARTFRGAGRRRDPGRTGNRLEWRAWRSSRGRELTAEIPRTVAGALKRLPVHGSCKVDTSCIPLDINLFPCKMSYVPWTLNEENQTANWS
jgi:hypothetical protein